MGAFVERGLACIVDGCNSSDAAAKYRDQDNGREYMICFSATCPKYRKATYLDPVPTTKADDWSDVEDDMPAETTKETDTVEPDKPLTALTTYFKAMEDIELPDRGLSHEALSHYGVRKSGNNILYPYFDGDVLVGYKQRTPAKDFTVKGNVSGKMLFGIQAFKRGGKFVTIHEGEFDAIAGYQMFGCKYANVSVPTGAGTLLSACKANFEWLNSFETVVFSVDADEAGKAQLAEAASLFNGKAKIVVMSPDLKDANGYLMARKQEEWKQLWWSAGPYVPDGIVAGNTLWDRVNEPMAEPLVAWPWTEMNDKLFGIYPRRLYCFTAGSGVGKSAIMKEIAYWILNHTEHKLGMLFLEEDVAETCQDFMSLYLNKPLHVPTTIVTATERREAFDATHGWKDNRIYYHDHFGSTAANNIIDRVTYLIKVMGCKFIFLDHLSIIVSSQEGGDERKTIDAIMTRLRMLVQETGATLFLVSHLSKNGKVYTEGAQVSTNDLRGSMSIEQLSDTIIAAERNGQHKDDKVANTTLLRILKSRKFGRLGLADALFYDRMTHRMTETVLETNEEGEPL